MGEGQARLAWLLFKQSWGLQEEPASQGRWESFSEREGVGQGSGRVSWEGRGGFRWGFFSRPSYPQVLPFVPLVSVLAGSLWRLHQSCVR